MWRLGGHLVVNQNGVTSKGAEEGLSPETTTASLGGHPLGGQPSVTTKGEPPIVPDSVRTQAKEYVIGHPDCSRDDVIHHLGPSVSHVVANAVIDELAKSEERFAQQGAE